MTSIVFSFILCFLFMIGGISGLSNPELKLLFSSGLVLDIILSLGFCASAVLVLIDYCKEDSRLNAKPKVDMCVQQQNTYLQQQAQQQRQYVQPQESIVDNQPMQKNENIINNIESQLSKLSIMKEKGMIDEEEYKALKKECLQNVLK